MKHRVAQRKTERQKKTKTGKTKKRRSKEEKIFCCRHEKHKLLKDGPPLSQVLRVQQPKSPLHLCHFVIQMILRCTCLCYLMKICHLLVLCQHHMMFFKHTNHKQIHPPLSNKRHPNTQHNTAPQLEAQPLCTEQHLNPHQFITHLKLQQEESSALIQGEAFTSRVLLVTWVRMMILTSQTESAADVWLQKVTLVVVVGSWELRMRNWGSDWTKFTRGLTLRVSISVLTLFNTIRFLKALWSHGYFWTITGKLNVNSIATSLGILGWLWPECLLYS